MKHFGALLHVCVLLFIFWLYHHRYIYPTYTYIGDSTIVLIAHQSRSARTDALLLSSLREHLHVERVPESWWQSEAKLPEEERERKEVSSLWFEKPEKIDVYIAQRQLFPAYITVPT